MPRVGKTNIKLVPPHTNNTMRAVGGNPLSNLGGPLYESNSSSILSKIKDGTKYLYNSLAKLLPDSTIGDLTQLITNFNGVSVEIGVPLAQHYMKDGQHEGANGDQIKEMSRIANEAFANACGQAHPQLAAAIRASADVEAAIEANNFDASVTKHFATHNVLTLSHFGCEGHSVGLNVYKNKDQKFDIVLCNRGAGNRIPGDDVKTRTFFQVNVSNLDEALSLLKTLRELKQAEGPEGSSGGAPTMDPVYAAMTRAGVTQVLQDVSAADQYTGHCGFLNKQAALKQVCQRVLGNVSVYKDQRQGLFQRIKSYVEKSDNADLKAMLREYNELQNITKTLKPLVKTDESDSLHDQYVQGIRDAIEALKSHANFTSEMGRVNVYIDRMLTNGNISKLDKAFLQQVKNNIILLEKDDDSSLKINQETFLTNVRNLTEIYSQLNSADLDTFEGAVAGMTEEQFKVSQALIQQTAEHLFEVGGGTFAADGAWETSTPTGKVLFRVANSKYLSHSKTHLSHISDIKKFQSELASISDTNYEGLVKHLKQKSISELSMAECRALEDKIYSTLRNLLNNGPLDLLIYKIITQKNDLLARMNSLKKTNYDTILNEYNLQQDPHKKLEICERVVSFSSDYPTMALEQFNGILPKVKQNVVYRKAFNEYSHLIDQFNSSKGEDQKNVRQQIIALCDSVIDAGEPEYGSHVEQFKKIKSQFET